MLILRTIVASVLILVAGTTMVFSLVNIMEPLSSAFSGAPASLDWGTPIADVMAFTTAAMAGLLVITVIWYISAPIQADVRQQFRRP